MTGTLYTVLTAREVCDWFAVSRTSVQRHALRALDNGDWRIRRSGATLLIHVEWCLENYGAPKGERPQYND